MKDAPVDGQLVCGERSIMANVSEPQLRKFVKTNPVSLIEYELPYFMLMILHFPLEKILEF